MSLGKLFKSREQGLTRVDGSQTLELKARGHQQEMQSEVAKALYAYWGTNMPVWMGDNLEEYIKNGYCRNSDVYAIVKYMLRCAIKLDYIPKYRTKGGKLEDAFESEVYGFFQDHLTNEIEENFIGYHCLTGNSYLYVKSPDNGINKGKPFGLEVLPAHITEIVFNTPADPIGGYKFTWGKTETEFPAEKISHWKNWNPDVINNGLYGMSPIQAAAMKVTESNEAVISSVRTYQNMGPAGILAAAKEDSFTYDQAEGLESRLQSSHVAGSWNRGKAVMTPAYLQWIQMGLSPVDLNILEQQRLSFEQLCRVWGFPVSIMDSKASTLDNMKVSETLLYANCVMPLCDNVKEILQRDVAKKFDSGIEITLGTSKVESLQANKKELAEWIRDLPFIKENRKQELFGEEPDPALDGYMYDSNKIFYPAGQPINTEPLNLNPDLAKAIAEREYNQLKT